MLKEKLLGIVMTQKMADARYVLKEEPGPGPTPTPTLTSVEWRNASVTPPTVAVGGTATIGGAVYAHYSDGSEVNVTAMATFSTQYGTIDGTTYQAPNEACTDELRAMYQGTGSAALSIQVGQPTAGKIYYGFAPSTLVGIGNDGDLYERVQGVGTFTDNVVWNDANGYWFFIAVPSERQVTSVLLSGYGFPLDSTTDSITVDGESYTRYKASGDGGTGFRSSDTEGEYTFTITIA